MTTISWGEQFFSQKNYWTQFIQVTERSTHSNGLVVDQAGNSYLLLEVSNDQVGVMESFVIKYQNDGKKIWSRRIEIGAVRTSAQAIAVDQEGNYYLTGFIEGQIDEQDLIGNIHAFLSKYRPDGQMEWLKTFGAIDGWTSSAGIVLDQANNCYLTGFTNSNLDGENLTGETDLFLTKYTSTGIRVWTRLLGVSEKNTNATALAIDQQDNLYLTGYTNGSLAEQNISIPLDALVAMYDSAGNKKWVRLIGAIGIGEDRFAEGMGIAVDRHGNCLVSGDTNGTLGTEKRIGIVDTFIIKYNLHGNQLWSKVIGVPHANTYIQGILVDHEDNLYLCGATDGKLEGQNKTGQIDTFVTKYTQDNKICTKLFGFNARTILSAKIAITHDQQLYVTGTTDHQSGQGSQTNFETAFLTTYFSFINNNSKNQPFKKQN